jgi:hypothetical protein
MFPLNKLQCLIDTGVITLFLSAGSCGLFIKAHEDGLMIQTRNITFQ